MARVVVFGGTGFVGAEVLRQLVRKGVAAVSLSRSGVAPSHCGDLAGAVEWRAGDAMKKETYLDALKGASAVVVSVGSPPLPFVDYAWQFEANGTSNERILDAASEARVPRAVLVNATMPQWAPNGYYDGKVAAEKAAERFAGAAEDAGAVVVKPSAIYGTRHQNGVPIPLAPVLAPVSWLLRKTTSVSKSISAAAPSVFDGLLAPPVPVESVATIVVEAALDDAYKGKFTILDPGEILKR